MDFRKLNKVTTEDAYPLPRIDDLLNALGKAKYMTTTDQFQGFQVIPISKEDICKTAFITRRGQYEYLWMPFGLYNAPASFQQMMNYVYQDLIGRNVLVYIDDVIIYSETFKQYLQDLHKVFDTIWSSGLRLNTKKYFFGKH